MGTTYREQTDNSRYILQIDSVNRRFMRSIMSRHEGDSMNEYKWYMCIVSMLTRWKYASLIVSHPMNWYVLHAITYYRFLVVSFWWPVDSKRSSSLSSYTLMVQYVLRSIRNSNQLDVSVWISVSCSWLLNQVQFLMGWAASKQNALYWSLRELMHGVVSLVSLKATCK